MSAGDNCHWNYWQKSSLSCLSTLGTDTKSLYWVPSNYLSGHPGGNTVFIVIQFIKSQVTFSFLLSDKNSNQFLSEWYWWSVVVRCEVWWDVIVLSVLTWPDNHQVITIARILRHPLTSSSPSVSPHSVFITSDLTRHTSYPHLTSPHLTTQTNTLFR